MQRSLPCRELGVYIIVMLGERPREQAFFHLSRESCSWILIQIDFEERQLAVHLLLKGFFALAIGNLTIPSGYLLIFLYYITSPVAHHYLYFLIICTT